MNKRIWISLLLLLIAAVLSVTSFLVLQERFSALGEALENAAYADVPLYESCRLHSDLCELRTAVESLPDLAEEPIVFRNTCIRSLHLLQGIRDSLSPTVENLL